jgi:hypothetical protein
MRALLHAIAGGLSSAAVVAGAQRWLVISGGRTPLGSALLNPGGDAMSSLFQTQLVAAGLAGAILTPLLLSAVGQYAVSARRPRVVAAALGVLYFCAVVCLAILLWMPFLSVSGRAPGRGAVSAGVEGAVLALLGLPLLAATTLLITAPVALIGGAVVGLAAEWLVRRSHREQI